MSELEREQETNSESNLIPNMETELQAQEGPGFDEQIESLLADLDQASEGIYVKLYRQNKRGGPLVWLDDYSADDLQRIDQIMRDDHGGGVFAVHIRGTSGKKPIRRKFHNINIGEPKKAEPLPAPAQDSNATLITMLAAIQKQQLEGFQLLARALSEKQPQPQGSLLEQIGQIGTLVQSLSGLIPQGGAGDMKLFMQAMEFGRDMATGVSDETREKTTVDLLMNMMDKFGPTIVEATRRRGEQQPPASVPRETQKPPKLTVKTEEPEPMKNEDKDPLDTPMLRGQLEMLVRKAELHQSNPEAADPTLYADLILDSAPTEQVQALVNDPEIIKRLEKINPDVAKYPEWFNNLREALIEPFVKPADE